MSSNIKNMTCFNAHNKKNKNCRIKDCRFWHDLDESKNCIINKVNKNVKSDTDLTLQEIGDLFNITRMRVCQIEKQTLSKMKKPLENLLT